MKLDDKTIRRILIGAVVIIVLLFVVVKVYQKTYYKYPNTVEDTELSITVVSAPSAGTITFTTGTTNHGYAVNDLVYIYGTGLTLTNTKGLATTGYSFTGLPSGALVVPVTAITGTTFNIEGNYTGTLTPGTAKVRSPAKGIKTTLDTALLVCQSTYALSIANGSATPTAALATLMTCLAGAGAPYVTAHCKWATAGTYPQAADGDTVASAAYSEYQTALTSIRSAYVFAEGRATAGTFTSYTGAGNVAKALEIVKAARQADITGATRRYLAKACPGFYESTATDNTTLYKSWTVSTAGTKPVSGYGFWSVAPVAANSTTTGITDAEILAWAQYSGTVTLSTTAPAGIPSSSGGLLAATPDKSLLGGAGTENWRKAYENGPGTYVTPTYATA